MISVAEEKVAGSFALECNSGLVQLAGDGLELYYRCADGNSHRLVATKSSDQSRTLLATQLRYLEYDEIGHRLYATARGESDEWETLAIDPETGEAESLDIASYGALQVLGEARMLVARESDQSPARFYDLDTLQLLHELSAPTGSLGKTAYDGRFLYYRSGMYSLPDFTWYAPAHMVDHHFSEDRRFMVAQDSRVGLSIWEWSGHAWHIVALPGLAMEECTPVSFRYLTPDARKLIIGTGSGDVCFVDLSSVVDG